MLFESNINIWLLKSLTRYDIYTYLYIQIINVSSDINYTGKSHYNKYKRCLHLCKYSDRISKSAAWRNNALISSNM